ncbi:MAG: Iron-regulated protein A [Prochlorococcus marinus str. MIT 9215]|nr:MAG: Iron-regulated protein A [Prochlorococcus marinus str. MIT 9215]
MRTFWLAECIQFDVFLIQERLLNCRKTEMTRHGVTNGTQGCALCVDLFGVAQYRLENPFLYSTDFLMARLSRLVPMLGAAALSASIAAACTPQSQAAPTEKEVSIAFVNNVVLPSYSKLVSAAEDLENALDKLSENPNEANLDAARAQWKATRKTWEVTETWAYGPAETDEFDPNLDDWPVSQKELAQALASDDFSEATFASLDTTGKGMHGIEYVLFGADSASDLTAAQLNYLHIAGEDLEQNAKGLLAAWSGDDGFGKADVEADPAKTVSDILEGMAGCLEETGAAKLGEALESPDTGSADAGLLESTFAGNTGADVVSNLSGVRMAWQDSRLQALVKAQDAALESTLTTQLNTAIGLAKALPARLNDKLDDEGTRQKIEALMAAIEAAMETTQAVSEKIVG